MHTLPNETKLDNTMQIPHWMLQMTYTWDIKLDNTVQKSDIESNATIRTVVDCDRTQDTNNKYFKVNNNCTRWSYYNRGWTHGKADEIPLWK